MGKPRIIGIALLALGILVCAGFFLLSKEFTPDLGLRWNLQHMEVVLKDDVVDTYMNLAAFRTRYPQYNDMSDEELTLRLQTKFFSAMKLEDYRRRFSVGVVPSGQLKMDSAGGDPIMIRWDMKDLKVTDPFTRATMTADAIEYGLLTLTRQHIGFPYRYALFAGLGLIAVGLAVLAFFDKKRYNS